MTGIVKTDQIQGAQGTTITIPAGNRISIADSATIGTLNATTMKALTNFTDSATFAGPVTFSGTVTGDNGGSVAVISNSNSAVTGASSIEIDLDTSGDYRYQELHLHQVYHTSGGANLFMTMRNEADASYLGSGLYSSICHGAIQNSSTNTTGDDGLWNGDYFRLHWYGIGDDATYEYSHQIIKFVDVDVTAQRTIYNFTQFGNSSGAEVVVQHGAGTLLSNTKNDRCKIYPSSGTINHKGYTLYGYKKA